VNNMATMGTFNFWLAETLKIMCETTGSNNLLHSTNDVHCMWSPLLYTFYLWTKWYLLNATATERTKNLNITFSSFITSLYLDLVKKTRIILSNIEICQLFQYLKIWYKLWNSQF
jgi:hypothetical protein